MSEETINDSGIVLGKSLHGSDTETDTSKIFEIGSFRATPNRRRDVRIFLVNNAAENEEVAKACRLFEVPVSKKIVPTIRDLEFEVSAEVLSVFIVDSFDDRPSSATRNGQNHLFLGCTALLEIANKEKEREETSDGFLFEELLFRSAQLGKSNRTKKVSKPLYCHALYGKVICFTGFREQDAEDVFTLSNRVKFMGGEVSKDAGCQVTHLVAKKWKYKKLEDKCAYAACFNIPVLTKTWIEDAWEKRNIAHFDAAEADFVAKYRFKLFSNCRVCFLGYPDDEKLHMIEVLRENGGEPLNHIDDSCTHVVTDESCHIFPKLSILSYLSSSVPVASSPTHVSSTKNYIASDSEIPAKRLKICDDDKGNVNHRDELATRKDRLQPIVTQRSNVVRNISNISAKNRTNWNEYCKARSAKNSKEGVEHFVDEFVLRVPSPISNAIDVETVGNNKQREASVLNDRATTNLSRPSTDGSRHENSNFSSYEGDKIESKPNKSSYDMNGLPKEDCSGLTVCEIVAESPQDCDDHLMDGTDIPKDQFFCVSPVFPHQPSSPAFVPHLSSSFEKRSTSISDDTIVDSAKVVSAASPMKPHVYVVRAEWFWASIQYEYRQNELSFKLGDTNQQGSNTPSALSNNSLYVSSSGRKRKRKRFKDRYLINGESSPQSAQKRRSSVSDLTRLSEGSLLDYTTSSTIADDSEYSASEKPKCSERYRRFLELLQTETNYVGILRTVMIVFKAELEAMVDDKKGAELLNATEIKSIFGNLPPIYVAHCKMLDELNEMKANWSEESSVGSLILKYSPDLVKAYPPFINFFEKTREMLNECDRTKPRFHAFLKLCQSKPECGRQGLQDLLIRPVQRLPSIYLLLKDILKDTAKNSFDHGKLESAIEELQKVMNYINEDKKRTEGQVVLFDIYNQIEKCPADLVSSHRCFIKKCEVTELNDELCGKKSPLVLFLFSDRIEACKKRTKASNKENSSSKHGNDKLKHVESIRLSSITKVIDVKEAEDCHNIFGIELDDSERVFYFAMTDSAISKEKYLHLLCNQILNVACRTDIESVLVELEPQQFKNDSSNMATGAFEKAFNKFASKTRKVSRALSFRALLTPKKAEPAMSLVSPFGIQNASTPSSPFANLRLAALPPVPNYSENDSVMSTPTSTQQLRKTKSSSFSMSSLRRL